MQQKKLGEGVYQGGLWGLEACVIMIIQIFLPEFQHASGLHTKAFGAQISIKSMLYAGSSLGGN